MEKYIERQTAHFAISGVEVLLFLLAAVVPHITECMFYVG